MDEVRRRKEEKAWGEELERRSCLHACMYDRVYMCVCNVMKGKWGHHDECIEIIIIITGMAPNKWVLMIKAQGSSLCLLLIFDTQHYRY